MKKRFVYVKERINTEWDKEDRLAVQMLVLGMIPGINLITLFFAIGAWFSQRKTVYKRYSAKRSQ